MNDLKQKSECTNGESNHNEYFTHEFNSHELQTFCVSNHNKRSYRKELMDSNPLRSPYPGLELKRTFPIKYISRKRVREQESRRNCPTSKG